MKLYYNDRCPPCRRLSRLAVAMSVGAIERVAIHSDEAHALRAAHPEWRGELLMIRGEQLVLGPAVFALVPVAIVAAWARWLRAALQHRRPSQ